MNNEFFNVDGNPATGGSLSSAQMRAEFAAISAGLDKLMTMAGNGSKVVVVNAGGTALTVNAVTGTGNVVMSADPTFSGNMVIGNINNLAITAGVAAGLSVAAGKTLTACNSIAFAGTDGMRHIFPSTNANIARTDTNQAFAGVQTFNNGIALGGAITSSGDLVIGTTNGTVARLESTANGVSYARLIPAATGQGMQIRTGGEASVNMRLQTTGSGEFRFETDDGAYVQAKILRTNNASNHVTLAASAGGNPTISTSGGNLNLASAGGVVSLTGGKLAFPAAQSASADANTLDDYEEGIWTPADGSGAGLSLTLGDCQYTKIGQMVFAEFDITYPATADGSNSLISGLPFTSQNTSSNCYANGISANQGTAAIALVIKNSLTMAFTKATDSTNFTNANLTGKVLRGVAIYRASA